MPDMSADDQYFLDFLSNIPDQVTFYTRYALNSIDETFDSAASSLRNTLESATWLPSQLRPTPPPPPAPRLPPLRVHPAGLSSYARAWINEHRAFSASFIAFVGTTSLLLWRQKKAYKRKRRARRAADGSRREVVVVMGHAEDSITRAIILDLERRGFIVYVIASCTQEEEMVRAVEKPDILPLHLDVSNPMDVQNTIAHFTRLFTPTSAPFSPTTQQQAQHQPLLFTSLILIPSLTATPAPLETIPLVQLSDALNAHVLATLTTAQSFLRPMISHHARLLLLTPCISESLHPPFHTVEATVLGALDGFAASLRAEMSTLGIDICHMKLGAFDNLSHSSSPSSASGSPGSTALARSARAELLSWPEEVRASYARNFVASTDDAKFALQGRRVRGSPLRELNNAVFDAVTMHNRLPGVWRVGRGSWVYPFIGNWVPQGIVGWILGLRRMDKEKVVGSGVVAQAKVEGLEASNKGSEVWEQV